MKLPKFGAAALLAGSLWIAYAPQARADAELRLTSGGQSITIVDGGGTDACLLADCVSFIGSIGGWVISATTGAGGGVLGSGLQDLNSFDASGFLGAASLTIEFTRTVYMNGHAGGFTTDIGGTLSNTGLDYSAWADSSNGGTNTFSYATQIGSNLDFTTTPFANFTAGAVGVGTPYSLTQRVVLSACCYGGCFASFDATIHPVPEPAGVVLLGSILLLVSGFLRRKLAPKESVE